MLFSTVAGSASIRGRAPYLLMALLLVCIGQVGCGEKKKDVSAALEDGSALAAPKGFTAFDTPNDQGGSISLTWDVWNIPTAGKENIQYVVYIADSPQGECKEAARFKATTSFMSDEEGLFGFSDSNRTRHWVAVRPEDFFPPASQGESDLIGDEIAATEEQLELFRAVDLSRELDGVLAEWDSLLRNKTEFKSENDRKNAQAELDARITRLETEVDKRREGKRAEMKVLEKKRDELVEKQERLADKIADESDVIKARKFFFKLAVVRGQEEVYCPEVVSAIAAGDVYHLMKTNNLVFMVMFGFLVLFFISRARRDQGLYLRRIAGLEAVDEAIGRATEMGRPVLFVHGLLGMDSISTIASVNILSKIAGKIAEYESRLLVPNYDPIVMSVCQEVVKEAYLKAGRPDSYRQDNIFYVTNDQFSYVSTIEGIMMREKPAANFFMGYFYAEALLLAETGSMTGAIQIAGTDSYTQLPFFIPTCDYTLMGEELYAASAYLSREPLLLGSIKGQDYLKLILMILIVLGFVLVQGFVGWDIINWFKPF